MRHNMIDFTKPIEVVDFLGNIIPAQYVNHQIIYPDRYEINFHDKTSTVNKEDGLLGPSHEN